MGFSVEKMPTYEDLLRFAVDCASTPLDGDFEQTDGLWTENDGPTYEEAVDYYVSTIEWARNLIGLEGRQHFDEEGAVTPSSSR